ncbi:MAG: hypothetical protein QXL94_05850 [Candidatus Parvarchaeum sp.]
MGIDRLKIGNQKGYYEANKELIQKYCKQDAYLTLELSKIFLQNTFNFLKAIPNGLYSGASIAKSY